MKKLFCLLYVLLPSFSFAQGMYVPSLLDSAVMADMNAKGCRFGKDEIYSFNHASMKDAVMLFGGGCTAEMISGEGLLVTNYHCGLSQVQRNSSVEHDYLTTGFWAKSGAEEIPCPGLSVTFIVRIEDVTDSIIPQIKNDFNESGRQSTVDSMSKILCRNAVKGTVYSAFVRPFYKGNQYFLFITQIFKDVRLVGAPPHSIGNFGGDTDNWEWPRHGCDFSLFRIYADKNNKAADYSKDNVPYYPPYFFPISIKGLNEGDFTMVYGFPGNTQEYLTSYGADLIENVADPDRVKVRTEKLKIWQEAMRTNDTIRIQYQAKYSSLSNGWKKWQGEELGLQQSRVIQLKKDFEAATAQLEAKNRINRGNLTFARLLEVIKNNYDSLKTYQLPLDYTSEVLLAPDIARYVAGWKKVVDYLKMPRSVVNDSLKKVLSTSAEGFFKNYNTNLDEEVMKALLPLYLQNVNGKWYPPYLKTQLKKYNNNSSLYIHYIFSASVLDRKESALKVINNLSKKDIKKLEADPLLQYIEAAYDANDSISDKYSEFNSELELWNRFYMKILMQDYPKNKFYPDANLTLRVTYGNIKSYSPRDGITAKWYSTTDGILEKYYSAAAPDDYQIPDDFRALLEKKDFGQYGDKGELHTCFIASNHTSGGNSGSPVLDANGNLIGLNFDREWEATMGDIYFNPDTFRNISVDTRYFLFLVDKYAGAGYLLNEMKIVK